MKLYTELDIEEALANANTAIQDIVEEWINSDAAIAMAYEQILRASLRLDNNSEGRGGRSPITNMGGNMAREELKEFRKNKGLTQAEMAEKLDLSLSHYKSIELGTHDPSIKLLTRFYEIFGNECDDVLRLFINK